MRYIVVNQNYIYEYDCGLTCGHEEYSVARSFNILFWLCNPFYEGFKSCESLSEWAKRGCHVYLKTASIWLNSQGKIKRVSIRRIVQDTACCYSCCIHCFKVWTQARCLCGPQVEYHFLLEAVDICQCLFLLLRVIRAHTGLTYVFHKLQLCLKQQSHNEENDGVLMREASKVAEWRTWYLLIQSERFQNKPRAVFSQHLRSYFLNMHAITCPQNMVWWNVVYTTLLLVWLSLAKWLATLITHSGDRWSVRRSRVGLFLVLCCERSPKSHSEIIFLPTASENSNEPLVAQAISVLSKVWKYLSVLLW